MKNQRGILQKDKLNLKISSWCLYSQVPLFVFLPNDAESSKGIFLQFSNSVIRLTVTFLELSNLPYSRSCPGLFMLQRSMNKITDMAYIRFYGDSSSSKLHLVNFPSVIVAVR